MKGLVEWRFFFKITWVLAFEVIIQNHYFIASFFPFFSPPVIKNIHHTTTHNFRVCAWRKCLETLLYFLELEELVKCWGGGGQKSPKNVWCNIVKAFFRHFRQAQILKLLAVILRRKNSWKLINICFLLREIFDVFTIL